MTRKLWLLLVVVLSSGLIAAGCGDDDDDDDGGSDEPAQTQEAPAEEDGGDGGDGGGTGGTPDTSDEAIEEAQRQCKQAIDAQAQLEEGVRVDLEKICEELDDPDDLNKVARKLCLRIVEQIPAGPARDQAKQQCEQSLPG
jgi:hypothetical protein